VNFFRQLFAILRVNLAGLPQRLGSSLTILVGVTSAVGVLVSMLAMGTGAREQELATVRADRVPVPAGRVLPGLGRAEVTSLAATLFAAEASGIAGWAVRTAAEYAKIRHQFGRPIGQFQAVKHRCARMLTAAEQAAAAAWDAAAALDPNARVQRCHVADAQYSEKIGAEIFPFLRLSD